MSVTGVNNSLRDLLATRIDQTIGRPLDQQVQTGGRRHRPAPARARAGPARPASESALTPQAPEGTDPALWSILTGEERAYFANNVSERAAHLLEGHDAESQRVVGAARGSWRPRRREGVTMTVSDRRHGGRPRTGNSPAGRRRHRRPPGARVRQGQRTADRSATRSRRRSTPSRPTRTTRTARMSAFLRGDNVELHQVMASSEEASLSLEMLIAVRDKFTDAYKSLISMQG